jgi:hypothetical protein
VKNNVPITKLIIYVNTANPMIAPPSTLIRTSIALPLRGRPTIALMIRMIMGERNIVKIKYPRFDSPGNGAGINCFRKDMIESSKLTI